MVSRDESVQRTTSINALGHKIPRLDLFELSVPWSNREEFCAFVVVMIMILVSDHSFIPLTMKIWVLSIIWFVKLIWEDLQMSLRGGRIVIVPASRSKSSSSTNASQTSQLKGNSIEILQYEALERISLIECDITMTTIKVLAEDDDTFIVTQAQSNNANGDASILQRKNELPSRLLFKIELSASVKRWCLWKRFEDIYDMYQHLVLLHGKEQIPRLKSITSLAKHYNRETLIGKIATLTSMNTLDQSVAFYQLHHDASFVQIVTETLLNWFLQLQQFPNLRDDITIRLFLQLPPMSVIFLRKQQLQQGQQHQQAFITNSIRTSPINTATNAGHNSLNSNSTNNSTTVVISSPIPAPPLSPYNNGHNSSGSNLNKTVYPLTMDAVAEVPDSLLISSSSPNSSTSTTTTTVSSATKKNDSSSYSSSSSSGVVTNSSNSGAKKGAEISSSTLTGPPPALVTNTTTTNVSSSASTSISSYSNTNRVNNSNNKNAMEEQVQVDDNNNETIHTYYLEDGVSCIQWQGNTIDTFQFLDAPEDVRAMVVDRRYAHGFKVRGLSYMTDKKKIDADPAIGRFLWYDVFPVDTELFGDRHDHIAAMIPMVQHRVRIISDLADKPFVMLINYQIPGDPPVSGVAYFAIPGNFHPDCAHSADLQKAKHLFERFVELPVENAAHRMVVPDLSGDKNKDYWARRRKRRHRHSNSNSSSSTDNHSTSQNNHPNNHHSIDNSINDNTNDSTNDNNSNTDNGGADIDVDVDVIGEGKILGQLPTTTTTAGPTSSTTYNDHSHTTNNNNTTTNNNNSATNGRNLATAVATAVAEEEEEEEEYQRLKIPTLGKDSLADWRGIQPAKTWGADIAWATVGEPGVLDRKAFQNMRFKLVPQMGEAPWVVQMAVSSTPCLLGNKIVQRYFRGAHYFELDMHIGSSGIANNVVGLCRKYVSSFVCNIGVVIQGENADELPERVLFCMSKVKMQLKALVAQTHAHIEHVHYFVREQAQMLPMPALSASAKIQQNE